MLGGVYVLETIIILYILDCRLRFLYHIEVNLYFIDIKVL